MWDQLEIRRGDQLPTFTVVILGDDNEPMVLDAAIDKVLITFAGQRSGRTLTVDGQVITTVPGGVAYDWQALDATELDVDTYDVRVEVTRAGTQRSVAPSRRTTTLVVRPGVLGLTTGLWDDDVAQSVWDDPFDLLVWI